MLETASGRSRPKPIDALTGIRFFAAMAVLLFHFGATFLEHSGVPAPITRLLHNGYLGVSVFFVLSGFILSYSHSNDAVDRRFLGDFYMARVARIYPVYLLALLIMLPLVWKSLLLGDVAKVLTMVQSWTYPQSTAGYMWVTQAWTLSIELFFYLAFPFLFVGARRCGPMTAAVVSVFLSGLIIVFGLSSIAPGVSDIPFFVHNLTVPLPLLRVPEFLLGIMLCRIRLLCPDVPRALAGSMCGLALCTTIVILMAIARDVHSAGAITVLVALLVMQLSYELGAVSRALSSKVLVLLGGASYAMYLLQGPVRAWCSLLVPHPLDKVASPVIIVAASILVFIYYEQPARKAVLSTFRTTLKRLSPGLPHSD